MRVSTLILTTTTLSLLSAAIPTGNAGVSSHPPSFGNVDASTLAPLSRDGKHIEDNYIVVLKKGVNVNTLQAHLSTIGEAHDLDPLLTFSANGDLTPTGGITKLYQPTTYGSHGFYGYAGAFTPSTLELIRSQPEVDYVEHDQIVTVNPGLSAVKPEGWGEPEGSFLVAAEEGKTVNVNDNAEVYLTGTTNITHQSSSPWGLARISHRPHLSFGTFTRYDYSLAGTAEGVDVYVIDTGININHVEFEGRAKWGITIPEGSHDYDGNGHGSHCAGTIGSRKYGVAKGVNIYAVKVLSDSGSGTLSDVVSGIQWAAEQAGAKAAAAAAEFAATGKTAYKGSVGSMSLGGGASKSTDDAVNAATAFMHMAVAAGNDNKDACNYSPARAKKALTVGASALTDARAYFSNHGTCTDIFAPGLNILSVWTNGNETTNTISGTSMATPHMAGLIAYLLSVYGTETLPFMSPKDLAKLEILANDSGKASLADVSDAEIASVSEVAESATGSLLYANVYSILPRVAQKFIPTPQILMAPTPSKPSAHTLTPDQMKGLLILLGSKGMLTDMPEGTPNVLAFNNATIAATKPKAE